MTTSTNLPTFQALPLKPGLPAFRVDEIERLRADLRNPAKVYVTADGALRWRSNKAVVPVFVIESDAHCECSAIQRAVYERELAGFVADYRLRDQGPSGEERAEMRAAFGPGTEVVNIITGRRTKL